MWSHTCSPSRLTACCPERIPDKAHAHGLINSCNKTCCKSRSKSASFSLAWKSIELGPKAANKNSLEFSRRNAPPTSSPKTECIEQAPSPFVLLISQACPCNEDTKRGTPPLRTSKKDKRDKEFGWEEAYVNARPYVCTPLHSCTYIDIHIYI